MKAIKLEIKETLIELPDSKSYYIEEHFLDPKAMTGPMIDRLIECVQTVYEIRQVKFPHQFDFVNYLVKVDDRKIFEGLVSIKNTDIQKLIDKEIDKLKQDFIYNQIPKTIREVKLSIKKLPWYKRLLNNF